MSRKQANRKTFQGKAALSPKVALPALLLPTKNKFKSCVALHEGSSNDFHQHSRVQLRSAGTWKTTNVGYVCCHAKRLHPSNMIVLLVQLFCNTLCSSNLRRTPSDQLEFWDMLSGSFTAHFKRGAEAMGQEFSAFPQIGFVALVIKPIHAKNDATHNQALQQTTSHVDIPACNICIHHVCFMVNTQTCLVGSNKINKGFKLFWWTSSKLEACEHLRCPPFKVQRTICISCQKPNGAKNSDESLAPNSHHCLCRRVANEKLIPAPQLWL